MNFILRASWAVAGLILSVPAFMPPVAFAAAALGFAFALGPFALLHVAFMLTIAWQSSRATTALEEHPTSA